MSLPNGLPMKWPSTLVAGSITALLIVSILLGHLEYETWSAIGGVTVWCKFCIVWPEPTSASQAGSQHGQKGPPSRASQSGLMLPCYEQNSPPCLGAAVVVMVLCVVWAGASLALMLSTLEAEQRAGVINTLLSSSPLAVCVAAASRPGCGQSWARLFTSVGCWCPCVWPSGQGFAGQDGASCLLFATHFRETDGSAPRIGGPARCPPGRGGHRIGPQQCPHEQERSRLAALMSRADAERCRLQS